jgi:hypothetical protein
MGQKKPYLMGAIGLAGAGYAQSSRDEYIGWNTIESKHEADRLRKRGLERMMHLSVCVPLPPYDQLMAGKLLALLAFSDPIQSHFRKSYKRNPLLAIVTTSAYGPHAAIYNRLNLRHLPAFSLVDSYSKAELYQHVGNTEGYTTAFATINTIEAAREVVEHSSRRPKRDKGMHADVGRESILFRAISLCGLSRDVFKLNQKGVYVGCLDAGNLKALKTGELKNVLIALPVDIASVYWNATFLSKALADKDRMSRVLEHKAENVLISRLME